MRRLLALGALALLLGGCAWSNRANRPVWNAFEEHLVPEGDGAFYASLPLTVPGGLLAVLADTFVVHPARVADDAWGDAGDLWEDVPWAAEYYSQLAILPFRAVGTPLLFLVSFLGRSCFDLPPRGAEESWRGAEEARREEQLLEALRGVARGGELDGPGGLALPASPWTPAVQAAFESALAGGSPLGRVGLLRWAHRLKAPPVLADPALGLRDPDPVVRWEVLQVLAEPGRVPDAVRAALRDDPSALVSARARALWP